MIKINAPKALVGNNDLKIVIVTVCYLLAAQLGLWLLFPSIGNYALWPPAGVALALIILLGHQIWPAILIGSLITYTFVFSKLDIPLTPNSVIAITAISIANVFEAIVGHRLYNLFLSKDETPFEKTSNSFIFLAIILFTALIGSVIFTLSTQSLLGKITVFSKNQFILNYLAEITGLWVFTNLILSWSNAKTHWKLTWWSALEALVFTSIIGVILVKMNSQDLSVSIERSFPFILIPFLLWIAFRSSIQATTLVVSTIALFSIYITIQGSGPFVLDNAQDSLLLLQLFILVIAITVIILSSAVHERLDAKEQLELFNENLEASVDKRTEDLNNEIKAREKTEKKIRISNNELRKTNEELDNFVYKVSHDLRAPISSILGLVNIAKSDNSTKNMLICIQQIEKSAIIQDNFIKDIIELTKNARVKPKAEKINFEQLIQETFDYLKYSMNSIPSKPKIHLHQDKVFYSDLNRMKVIFNNIISNSIKYSDPTKAKINIDIEVMNGHAKINIGDNGNGIDKKYQNDVFKMFFRATDKNAGSGLGLYIVKETVQKLRGDVSLESELNKGTTLKMRLPNMKPV
ncbi:MAG: MASE1 domain-containing protein [Cyclobacteriaceae bacterium]|nr:MASE1 domain-containing protein [Cyclobacteriaceae bacterium]